MNLTTLAYDIASTQHQRQLRKDNKTPYINHLEAVVTILNKHLIIEYNKTQKLIDSKWQTVNVLGLDGNYIYNGYSVKEYQSVGWLHDVIEDCSITKEDLMNAFLIDVREEKNKDFKEIEQKLHSWIIIIEAVDLLTKKPDQNYVSYLKGIKDNQLAKLVKLADLKHNMSDLKYGSLMQKYQLTEWFLQQ